MEPDIADHFKSISLTEAESPPVAFPEGNRATNEEDTSLYMVGKVLNPRPVNPETVAKQMRRAFNPLQEMSVKFLGENKFLFRFQHSGDFAKVEEGRPWHFENHLLVLNAVPPGGYAGSVTLNHCPFTVQIHNLPFLSFPRGAAEALGNRIGQFLNAELDAKGDSKVAALRLRIALDIRQPLIRALPVPAEDGSMVLAAVTYEKLPIFCSECGRLDHQVRYCKSARDKPTTDRNNPQYGPWLKATRPRFLDPSPSKKINSEAGTPAAGPLPSEPKTTPAPSFSEALHGDATEREHTSLIEPSEGHTLRGDYSQVQGDMQVEETNSMDLILPSLDHPPQANPEKAVQPTPGVVIHSMAEPMDI
ncbi:hypothetical protein M569_09639, partial [Genlisea aurea]